MKTTTWWFGRTGSARRSGRRSPYPLEISLLHGEWGTNTNATLTRVYYSVRSIILLLLVVCLFIVYSSDLVRFGVSRPGSAAGPSQIRFQTGFVPATGSWRERKAFCEFSGWLTPQIMLISRDDAAASLLFMLLLVTVAMELDEDMVVWVASIAASWKLERRRVAKNEGLWRWALVDKFVVFVISTYHQLTYQRRWRQNTFKRARIAHGPQNWLMWDQRGMKHPGNL